MTKTFIQFAGYTFDDLLPHAEGDIPISTTERGVDGIDFRAGLAKGRSYTPGSHPFPVAVEILKGKGAFFLNGETLPYRPGVEFIVDSNQLHSFSKVESDTVFIKKVPCTIPV